MNRPLQSFPLEDAVLCVNCHAVSNSQTFCGHCQSLQLISIARSLGVVQTPEARLLPHAPAEYKPLDLMPSTWQAVRKVRKERRA